MEKIYHIYIKDQCIFHSLSEEEFKDKWETLRNFIDLLVTDYTLEDISYEELSLSKKVVL